MQHKKTFSTKSLFSSLENHEKREGILSFCVERKKILTTALFALLLIGTLLAQLKPINIYYNAVFSSDAIAGSEVTFVFSENKAPGTERQTTNAVTDAASIRLDPLNNSSKQVKISTPVGNSELIKLEEVVKVGDQQLYTVSSIDGEDITKEQIHNRIVYSLTEQQINKFHSEAKMKSEIKLFLCGLFFIAYFLTMIKMFLFKKKNKIYAVFLIVCILISGFLANLWLVKKPLVATHSYASDNSEQIQDDGKYTISQSFISQRNQIKYISIPISIPSHLSPSDTDKKNYSSVYDNSTNFKDKYIVSLSDQGGNTIYKSLVSPAMFDDSQSQLILPVNINSSRGSKFTLNLDKVSEGIPHIFFSTALNNGNSSAEFTKNGEKIINYGRSLVFSIAYQGFPYRIAITAIILAFVLLVVINLLSNMKTNKCFRVATIVLNYVSVAVYSILQFLIYIRYVRGFPDEPAHISYSIYLQKTHDLIPNFSQMGIYAVSSEDVFKLSQSTELNYLGHPPFFYHLIRIFGGITINDDTAAFSLNKLRLISFLVGLSGLLILFYIGFTRLPKTPILHLLYGLMLISPPNVVYIISGVSNDSMAILGVSIFVFGAVRFIEQRYTYITYLLIATGITCSLLAKLTAGMIVVVSTCFILIYILLVKKEYRKVFSLRALPSLPIYIIPFAYFAFIYLRYHTIQPSYQTLAFADYVKSPHYVGIDSRSEMGVWQYLNHFFEGFLYYWQTLAGHTQIPKPDYPIYSLDRIALFAILLMPLLLLFFKRKRNGAYLICLVFGVYTTIAYQLFKIFNEFYDYGQAGATSSRYYCCAISIFAIAVMWLILQYTSNHANESLSQGSIGSDDSKFESLFPQTSIPSSTIIFCALFVILLVFDGFIYPVLYQASSIPGFTVS